MELQSDLAHRSPLLVESLLGPLAWGRDKPHIRSTPPISAPGSLPVLGPGLLQRLELLEGFGSLPRGSPVVLIDTTRVQAGHLANRPTVVDPDTQRRRTPATPLLAVGSAPRLHLQTKPLLPLGTLLAIHVELPRLFHRLEVDLHLTPNVEDHPEHINPGIFHQLKANSTHRGVPRRITSSGAPHPG